MHLSSRPSICLESVAEKRPIVRCAPLGRDRIVGKQHVNTDRSCLRQPILFGHRELSVCATRAQRWPLLQSFDNLDRCLQLRVPAVSQGFS